MSKRMIHFSDDGYYYPPRHFALVEYNDDSAVLVNTSTGEAVDGDTWADIRARLDNYFSTSKKSAGFVYLIGTTPDGLCKIGCSKNPESRLNSFRTSMPYDLSLLYCIQTDDMYGRERDLHNKFKEYRIRGEWFKLPSLIVETFDVL